MLWKKWLEKFTVDISRDAREFTGWVLFMSMFYDIFSGNGMHGKCQSRIFVRKEILNRTIVIHFSWFWKEVVLYKWRQSTMNLGQNWRKKVLERMSNFSSYDSIVERSTQKAKNMWKNFLNHSYNKFLFAILVFCFSSSKIVLWSSTKLFEFFHFIETFLINFNEDPSFASITFHEEVVDLVVEVLQLERNEVTRGALWITSSSAVWS